MKKRKKIDLEQYDHITVADMNIKGLPWYQAEPENNNVSGQAGDTGAEPVQLTPQETRRFIFYAVGAALLVGGAFFFLLFLFLLFCVNVWL